MTMTTDRTAITAAAWSGPFELPTQTPVIRPSSMLEVVAVIDDDMAFGPPLEASGTELPVQGEVVTVVNTDPSTPTVACGPPIIVDTEQHSDGQLYAIKLARDCSGGPHARAYADRAVDALIDNEGTILEHLVWESVTETVPTVATGPAHALAIIESSHPLTMGDAGVLLMPSASMPYFAAAGLIETDSNRKAHTHSGVPVAVMTADSDPAIAEAVWVPTFTVWRSTLDSYPLVNTALNDFTTVATRSYLLNLQRELAVFVTVS